MGRRSGLDVRGIESLPIFLLLTAFLSVTTAGLGLKAVEMFETKRDEQICLHEFCEFLEKAREVCYGAGEAKVTLSRAEIVLRGNLVLLNRPPRVESLPVSFSRDAVLKEGVYTISLKKTNSGWFLEIE
jgi:hypothetical protein